MTDVGVNEIALIIRRWLDWHAQRRSKEGLETGPDTAIMSLPVPFWPSHAQFENWIVALEQAAARISALEAERDRWLAQCRELTIVREEAQTAIHKWMERAEKAEADLARAREVNRVLEGQWQVECTDHDTARRERDAAIERAEKAEAGRRDAMRATIEECACAAEYKGAFNAAAAIRALKTLPSALPPGSSSTEEA